MSDNPFVHPERDDEPGPYRAPEAEGGGETASPQDAQTWAVLAHVSSFAGWIFPFGNILGPLIIYLVKKDESAYVRRHASEALNFQISVTLWSIVCVVLMFVLIGFLLIFVLLIMDIVCTIVAAVKASNGQDYRYPLTLRLVG